MAKAFDRDSGGGGGFSGLQDKMIMHVIYLSRLGNTEAKNLLDIIDKANADIKKIILKAKSIDTKRQYEKLSKELKEIAKGVNEALSGKLKSDFEKYAQYEFDFMKKAYADIGISLGASLPSPERMFQIASFTPYTGFNGNTFETYLNSVSDSLFRQWDLACRSSLITGRTAKDITREVLGSIKDNYPGSMQSLRNSVYRNTHCALMSMNNKTRAEVYEANESLFDYYLRLETLGGIKFNTDKTLKVTTVTIAVIFFAICVFNRLSPLPPAYTRDIGKKIMRKIDCNVMYSNPKALSACCAVCTHFIFGLLLFQLIPR